LTPNYIKPEVVVLQLRKGRLGHAIKLSEEMLRKYATTTIRMDYYQTVSLIPSSDSVNQIVDEGEET